jgi:hypothetical protein
MALAVKFRRKNHGLRASLRFTRRPWFQKPRSKWYYYWGQVTIHIRFIKVPIRLPRLGTETTKFLDQGVILKKMPYD